MNLSDKNQGCVFRCNKHQWPNGCSLLDNNIECQGFFCHWHKTVGQWDASTKKAYAIWKKSGRGKAEYIAAQPAGAIRERAIKVLQDE